MTQTATSYQRALNADPGLRAIDDVVDALCAVVRPSDTLCAGCVWEAIIKPLARPLVGWERGYPPDQAEDPETSLALRITSAAELTAQVANRVPAATDTERWMRTSEAYDAVTDAWFHRLHMADPGHGHGMARGHQ